MFLTLSFRFILLLSEFLVSGGNAKMGVWGWERNDI